ncbi:hypothetical protein MNBD_CHLOROFLEXI01-2772 [hydrothermal vent metagenome]|uniref:Uncharacterized protein n=1 Tax=hydrothermal vent metagenome TaxID=652676 RepID=A0A3B0ULH1_9ZZZZ
MAPSSPTPLNEITFGQRTQITRGMKTAVILVALFLILLIAIIIYPITATTPTWMFAFQSNVYNATERLAPYFLVGLLGATVAMAELVSTFQTYPREALRTRWAWILIFVNVVAAVIALIVVRTTMSDMNEALQILSVGVGFQAIIRTRFVLAKRIGDDGEEGEVALNLGWLYDQFQNLARTQIDLELMNNRRTAVTRLLDYYPSLAELYDIAWYTITARATLSREEEELRKSDLEKLLDPKAPENFAKSSIALMILENGGQAYVELLLAQAMEGLMPEAMGMTLSKPTSADKLIWQLVEEFSLEELVMLAKKLTPPEKVLAYIIDAAKPDPEVNIANQKATIAHFMVQQIGVEPLQEAVGEANLPERE